MKIVFGSIVFAVVIVSGVFYAWHLRDVNECNTWIAGGYDFTPMMSAQCKQLNIIK